MKVMRLVSQAREVFVVSILMLGVVVVAAVGASASERSATEIPFTLGPRGHLLIDVSINGGESVPFALDTAAGRTVLNEARLDRLGVLSLASGETVQGGHGEHGMGLAEVESLAFGGVEMGQSELGTMDLGYVESPGMELYGVLGVDVLSRFDLDIDLAGETVTLHPLAASLEECAVCEGEIAAPFELAGGTHIRFEVEIDGQPITAFLDTGSGRSGMNHRAADSIGVTLPPMPAGSHAPALRIGALHLGGGVLARDVVVGVIDLPAFEALGVADRPAFLLGTEALAGRRVGISYGIGQLSIR